MTTPSSRFVSRASTLALAVVGALGLLGLLWGDRLLRDREQQEAALDASEAAALVQSFLRVHVVALGGAEGLYETPGTVPTLARLRDLMDAQRAQATGFRRVFLTDSAGLVRQELLIGVDAAPMPSGIDVDTFPQLRTGLLAARGRTSGRPQISPPGALRTGERGIVLMEPIMVGGRFAGFAGATITSESIAGSVGSTGRAGWLGFLVTTDSGDTVAMGARDSVRFAHALAEVTPAHESASATNIVLPDGGRWVVRVVRTSMLPRTRFLLWSIGLGMLAILALGVLHDRRQAQRIAERSTELERLSAELLRANRAKSEFLANVSHELRTPLNAIVGFVDLLRDGVYGELGPRQRGPVQRIEASANHLRHLVDQILDLAKMAAGRLEVHTEILDLRPFVLDVVSEVESLLNEKGLSLSVSVGTTLPRVRTDPGHLRSILVNLLGNAVKFTPNGAVTVRAKLIEGAGPPDAGRLDGSVVVRPPGGRGSGAPGSTPVDHAPWWITLQVIDTGIGIDPKDRERIFEEFEQVNAGARGDAMARGTGLGLPISRRLARLLGGDITVESEAGRGSIFSLWLPVHPADLMAKQAEQARRVTGANTRV